MSTVKMDMRWQVSLEHPTDLMIDAYSTETLRFGSSRFFYLVHTVDGLPGDDPNKTELQRYVDRCRHAFKANNMDALEGWLNALAVGVKSARLFIPKANGKLKQETDLVNVAQPKGAKANKAKADANNTELDAAIINYRDNFPNALRHGGPEACLRFLESKGLLYGLAETTVFQRHIKPLFAKKRAELKAEK